MSDNTYGKLFRVTTWGESHGPAIGCVIDGCPPGVLLTQEGIQRHLDMRKPGTSKYVTQRREADRVRILSGVFEDDRTDGPRTMGTPICLMIENTDQRSKDYADIRDKFRPGHADYTYFKKYGLRDYRGGGRSSARETASRVAAGAVAQAALMRLVPGLAITAGLVQMGPHKIDRMRADWSRVGENPFWCPDAVAADHWAENLEAARKAGSSLGAVIEVRACGVPAGLGAPVYGKLDTELGAALMSINAVKGVEIGDGFETANYSGEHNADEIRSPENGQGTGARFTSNHAGGILGGISSGQDIIARFVVKPTSSILHPRKTIDVSGQDTDIATKGRHDPCVGIRAVPVGVAMLACVLLDHVLRDRGQIGTRA